MELRYKLLPTHTGFGVAPTDTTGFGFTSTVAVIDGPLQPFAVGTIVKVTVTGDAVGLLSDPIMLPLPEAGMPVTFAVLLRVHA